MLYDERHNDAAAVAVEPTSVTADDGRALVATWHRPVGDPIGAVLVASAMATPSWFYAPFARHLAECGLLVLTFDYRGVESREAMRRERGDLDRWAADARDALNHLRANAFGLPTTWVGHSLGGQIVPFADHQHLDQIVLVASGDGSWRKSVHRHKWGMPLFASVIAPAAWRVAGYYPGARLGVLGDAPSAVMRQWLRWCDSEDYLGVDHPDAAELYAAVRTPMTALAFADDELMSADSLTSLLDRYTGVQLTRQLHAPRELGVPAVGHHGFFRSANRALWDRLVVPHLAGIPA